MKTNIKYVPFFQSTTIQLYAIVSAIIYLFCFLYWQQNNTPAIDPIAKPLQISAKEASKASTVEVGFYINSFPEFSFEKGNFVADGIVWFKFPSGAESLKTLESFTIANGLLNSGGNLLYISEPIIKLIDNYVLASYNIQVNFTAHVNHKNFPMSDHTLSIVLENKHVTPYELNFVSKKENFLINKENLEIAWEPKELSVQTGYFMAPLTNSSEKSMEISYPVVVFTIHFQNIGIRDLVSLYFPLLLIFFIILFCLLLDISDLSRLSYIATAVPILVLFRMVIDSVSPSVGYNTHIDYFFYLLVILSLAILLFQIYVVLTLHQAKQESETVQKKVSQRLDYLNSLMLMSVLVILVIVTTLSHWR